MDRVTRVEPSTVAAPSEPDSSLARGWVETAWRIAGSRGTWMRAGRAPRRSLSLALALGLVGSLVLAGSALAAPQWGLEVLQRNPYGLHAHAKVSGQCAAGLEEATPLEAAEALPCLSTDPFSGSGQSFDRESGFNTYFILISNTGTSEVVEETPQPILVQVTLPEGVALAGPQEISAAGWQECHIVGLKSATGELRPRRLTCEREGTKTGLQPGHAYPPLPVRVYVGAETKSPATATVRVSGGEAPAPGELEHQTALAPAVAPGIHEFCVSDSSEVPEWEQSSCEGGAQESLAGGHPLAFSTLQTFNFTSNFEGKLLSAGSGEGELEVGPREVEVALPPGMNGNPQTTRHCALANFLAESCSETTAVGYIRFDYIKGTIEPDGTPSNAFTSQSFIYNLTPPPGSPAAFGFVALVGESPIPFVLLPKVRSDSDYGLTVGDEASASLRSAQATFCSYGVMSAGEEKAPFACKKPVDGSKPFLSNPTQCDVRTSVTLHASGYPGEPPPLEYEPFTTDLPMLSGCQQVPFEPEAKFEPSAPAEAQAGEPAGMTFVLGLPGANPVCHYKEGTSGPVTCPPAESQLRKLKLQMPEGVAVSPAAAEGLVACQPAQFGAGTEFSTENHPLEAGKQPLEPAQEAHCPTASQVGTVEVFSPDLPSEEGAPLTGELYVGQPECSPCSGADAAAGRLLRTFLQLHDRKAGLLIKLEGTTTVNEQTGQLTTTFNEQPELPFEELILHLKGGPRAVLQNPTACVSTPQSVVELTPWSSESETAKRLEAPFGAFQCPTSVPFAPGFNAGTAHPSAGQFSPLSLTTEAGPGNEQGLQQLEAHMPPGLTAKIAGVPLCAEEAANAGTCGEASQIGSVTVAVGPGTSPFYEHGQVYLTGPYGGGPFGLSIVVPTTAGPFTLEGQTGGGAPNAGRGEQVVRSAILVDERTAAVTVRSNPIPQMLDGIPIKIAKLDVEITRHEFELNPTDCTPQREAMSAKLTSSGGATHTTSVPFDVGGCAKLPFAPSFTATTQAKTSRGDGASLTVKVTQRPGEAHIRKTDIQLPGALPSRLTTLQHACTETEFAASPHGKDCPTQAFVGTATATTPLLRVPLTGPAILVSHGGQQFPDLNFLLEGEGVRIDLVGHTEIKKGITFSRFEEVPDTPITSFETVLPEGPASLLSANGNLCTQRLLMPTTIVGHNGAQVVQQTKVAVTGCPHAKAGGLTNAQRLKRALRACRTKDRTHKPRRLRCERKARRRYGRHRSASTVIGVSTLRGVTGERSAGGPAAAQETGAPSAATAGASSAASSQAEAGPCPNEARRAESDRDLETPVPNAELLPECRAEERVSPLDKQAQNVRQVTAVAPGGDAVGFIAAGGFEDPQNFYPEGPLVYNSYTVRRVESGCPGGAAACWLAASAFAPAGLIQLPNRGGALASDFTPDLSSRQIACGVPRAGVFGCAVRKPDGEWAATPQYWPSTHALTTTTANPQADVGQSADLGDVFFQPNVPLLPEDGLPQGGLYELSGLDALARGEGTPQLRLVNLKGRVELGWASGTSTIPNQPPLLGDVNHLTNGTAFQAVSRDGERAFFTAFPTGAHQQQVYARVPCTAGEECEFLESEGQPVAGSGRETIQLSAPECGSGCDHEETQPGLFEGASADGSRVFFTSAQELLPEDTDEGIDLYEYDFDATGPQKLRLLSLGEASPEHETPGDGAEVLGVVRVASDGSRVYFVAGGVLTEEANSFGEQAQPNGHNLYVVQTATGKVSFIAALPREDSGLWGAGCAGGACDSEQQPRLAQLTPDGRDLVFDTHARLDPGDKNGCTGGFEGVEICAAEAVYRYDAETGNPAASTNLTWISHAAPGFTAANLQKSALIAGPGGEKGATADFADTRRSISGCPEPIASEPAEGCTEAGEADGQDIVFESSEPLQQGAIKGVPGIYLWHCSASCAEPGVEGEVSLISGADNREGGAEATISASGRDIFFTTAAELLPGDTDEQTDIYDARVNGGIPLQTPPSCRGEECQGLLGAQAILPVAASSIFASGRNVVPQATVTTTSTKPGSGNGKPKAKKKKGKRTVHSKRGKKSGRKRSGRRTS